MASAVRGQLADKTRRKQLKRPRELRTRNVMRHVPTDSPIDATPEDLEPIRCQLSRIKRMLAGLFGSAYDGGRESLQARATAADLIEQHFDEIVEQWTEAVLQAMAPTS